MFQHWCNQINFLDKHKYSRHNRGYSSTTLVFNWYLNVVFSFVKPSELVSLTPSSMNSTCFILKVQLFSFFFSDSRQGFCIKPLLTEKKKITEMGKGPLNNDGSKRTECDNSFLQGSTQLLSLTWSSAFTMWETQHPMDHFSAGRCNKKAPY